MTYSIFDNGNLVVAFDREDEALHALERLAAEDEGAAERILLVATDDAGNDVYDCAPGERVPHAV
jgi:fructoselysine-6-P-deglycase FrlB-like protein